MKKKEATRLKEDEEEEEEEKEAPCKEEAVGRVRKPKKHRFEKEDEEEDDEEEEEEEDESMGSEGVRYKEKKKKKKIKKEEEEAEEEEEEEEETKKGEMGGINPTESGQQGTTEGHTITPGKMTGQAQNVFVPPTQIPGERIGTGTTPGQETYSSKSVENPDLLKSPLFVELSGQIGDFQKSISKKMESFEKSITDRMANIQKTAEKIEQFYKQPFYKAIDENVNPEAITKQSVKEQIASGKIRFTE